MIERPAGSYIMDGKGELTPNLDDEAMKKREEEHTPAPLSRGDKKKEVKANG